ncbi:MAG: hypothetical protein U5J78_06380 [Parasphingorhabdus sp.]|nr:hypothetical protein [Parasphingorhabdus sp.]
MKLSSGTSAGSNSTQRRQRRDVALPRLALVGQVDRARQPHNAIHVVAIVGPERALERLIVALGILGPRQLRRWNGRLQPPADPPPEKTILVGGGRSLKPVAEEAQGAGALLVGEVLARARVDIDVQPAHLSMSVRSAFLVSARSGRLTLK